MLLRYYIAITIALMAITAIITVALTTQPIPTSQYQLSPITPAPFKLLTIKGKVKGGITTVSPPPPPASPIPTKYTWQSKDRRFKLIDPDIYTKNDELFTYRITIGPTSEVNPQTHQPIPSTISITPRPTPTIQTSLFYYQPNQFSIETRLTLFTFHQATIQAAISYNTKSHLSAGIGLSYEF